MQGMEDDNKLVKKSEKEPSTYDIRSAEGVLCEIMDI